MAISRRSFLLGASAGTLALLAAPRSVAARGLMTEPKLDELVKRALAAATKAGASYADVRVVRMRRENVSTREDRVERVASSEDYGVGVRVIAGGAWGFAATPSVTAADAERAAADAVATAKANASLMKRPVTLAPVPANVDVWQTPLTKDPFKIPLADKAEFLLAINAEALKVPGVKFCSSSFSALGEWKLMATSDGAYIEQNITRLGPEYSA